MAVVNHPLLTTNGDVNLKQKDILSTIIKLYPDTAKFLTIINKFGKRRPINNVKFEMMEQDIEILKTTVATATVGGETSITVATGDGAYFTPNDTIIIKSGATYTQYLVTAVSGDVLTITPTAGVHSAGDLVIRGAKAVAENGTVSPSYSLEPSLVYNYAQLFDESFTISLQEAKELKYYLEKGGESARLKYEREQMTERFLRSVARAFYFGQRGTINGSSGTVYFTGGLDYFITNGGGHVFDATGITEAQFRTFLKQATVKGSEQRILLCSGSFLDIFADWKIADRSVLQVGDKDKLGFKVNEYINDYCELLVVKDTLLGQIDETVAYLVDPKYIGIAELSPMSKKVNAQGNDQYGYKEAVYWCAGFDLVNMGAFAKFTNVGS